MIKLTKQQRKDRDRIEAWIKGEPFRENSRDKTPKVPELSQADVLNTYVPQFISDGGKFYTPPAMAEQLVKQITIEDGMRVIDLCAGIGNLLAPLSPGRSVNGGIIDAFELDPEACEIGRKLFPLVNWTQDSPFEHVDRLTGQYDLVLLNPPFGTKWGTHQAEVMSEGRAKRSEHYFLELAIRAPKPGGTLAVIAPYNYISGMPKKLKKWFDTYATGFEDLGKLKGDFRFTKVTVHGWKIGRSEAALKEVAQAIEETVAPEVAVEEPVTKPKGKWSVSLDRKEFQRVLGVVNDFTSGMATMPILSHVYIGTDVESGSKMARIFITDLDTSWETRIPCKGDVNIQRCIPAAVLLKEVKALHSDIAEVELSFIGEEWMMVNGRCRIVTVKGEEYPVRPPVSEVLGVELAGLADKLKRVLPAGGESDTRYTLNTVCVDIGGGHIVATDGHRLHIEDIGKVEELPEQFTGKLLLPRKSAQLLAKYGASGRLSVSAPWVSMDLAGGRFFSRLVEGAYPDYNQVIPKSNPIKVRFSGGELLKVLEGALPLCRNNSVKILVNGQLVVKAENPDIGEYSWHIPCATEGKEPEEEILIGFNAKYIIDAVRAFTTKESDAVVAELPEPTRPKSGGGASTTVSPCLFNSRAVVMPMRV